MKKLLNKQFIVILTIFFMAIGLYFIYDFYSLKNAEVNIPSNEKQISIYTDQKKDIHATAQDQKYEKNIEFNNYDHQIISVSKNGEVYGLHEGKTNIEVKIKDSNKKKNIEVEVKPHTYCIQKKYQKKIKENEQIQLSAIDEITNEPAQLEWASSDNTIATVDQGKVLAKKHGQVSISIVKNGKIMDSINLEVEKSPLTKDDIQWKVPKSIKLELKEEYHLKDKISFLNNKTGKISYMSSDESIASVSEDGIITAKQAGNTKVTVTIDSLHYTVQVTVKKVNLSAKGPYITDEMLKKAGISSTKKLMIVAHPDDETLWGGGHLAEGQWFVVCLTNGDNKTRKQEYKNALKCLGAKGIILSYYDLRNGQRDDWKTIKKEMMKDITKVMNYQAWDMIVTHNPEGEYGHIHHKMTNRFVTEIYKQKERASELYYFGTFYKPGEIPTDLVENISDLQQTKKNDALNLYTSQLKSIQKKWLQMLPYEYWTKAN